MRYLANVTTLRFLADNCTGCRRCVEVCPHGVFTMNGKKAKIIDRDLCMECGACAQNCAYGAIQVNAGVGCANAIINGMVRKSEPVCGCSSSSTSCCG